MKMESQIKNWNHEKQTVDHVSSAVSYLPEQNPFQSIFVDLTHKCNMECKNCYIPNREIPDMDADWFFGILKRLPRRTRIRLTGAEATLRKDLPDIIQKVRKLGHLPILMTNGLKLANRNYVRELKASGLRTVYLSLNGGFDDRLYKEIDDLACAKRKIAAYENLYKENMYISIGMILVRGINESQLNPLFNELKKRRQVYELKLRSIGSFGRYIKQDTFSLEELIDIVAEHCHIEKSTIPPRNPDSSYLDFKVGHLKIQLTEWPDLNSEIRGRLAPDGTIQPFFEHIIANEGGY